MWQEGAEAAAEKYAINNVKQDGNPASTCGVVDPIKATADECFPRRLGTISGHRATMFDGDSDAELGRCSGRICHLFGT